MKKIYKLRLRFLVALAVTIWCVPTSVLGSEIECPKYTSVSDSNVKKVLEGYKTYAGKDEINKKYILCLSVSKFDNDGIISISDEIKINHSDVDYSLVIYGLNLKMASAPADPCTSALITISGANVTLQSATLTGPGTCTGIQMNGQNMAIQSGTISNFYTGIQVGDVAVAGKNIAISSSAINNVETAINLLNTAGGITIDKLSYSSTVEGKALDPAKLFDLVAKKCVTTTKDANGFEICDVFAQNNKVSEVVGVVPSAIAGECKGVVSLFKKKADENAFSHFMNCATKTLTEKIFIAVDELGSLSTIDSNSCAFICDSEQSGLISKDRLSFIYSDVSNGSIFSALLKSNTEPDKIVYVKEISDLPDVISTGLGGIVYVPTTSGANGSDSGTTVYVPGLDSGASVADQAGSNDEVNLASAAEAGEADTMKEGSSVDSSILPPSDTPSSDEQTDNGNAKPITIKDKEDDGGDSPSQGVTGFGTLSQGCSLTSASTSYPYQTFAIIILLAGLPALLAVRRFF